MSPLARKADIALIVDPIEDAVTQMPMVGRILYLLMIDILAVGVAMRSGAPDWTAADVDAQRIETGADAVPLPTARRAALGVHTAEALAHLSTHSRGGVG